MSDTKVKKYRFSKARSLLQSLVAWYQKEGQKLPEKQRKDLVDDLKTLDSALLSGDKQTVNSTATKLDKFADTHVKKSWLTYALEIALALAVALLIATVVRQMWFELQEIPTGSMRPTYKEEDKLLVSKTAYGINIPFTTQHFYFDPSLVKRTNVFTFSADNIPMYDSEGSYFGIFPYKKRLVKRIMGLPGDTVYFYGGRLFGIDKEGKPINDLRDAPWMQGLEYIPFLTFLGAPSNDGPNTAVLKHMDIPLGRVTFGPLGIAQGMVKSGDNWIPDDPYKASKPHTKVETYSDNWGFKNYAMVQLVKKEQIDPANLKELKDAEFYLELRHHPSLSTPSPFFVGTPFGQEIVIPGFKSYLPMKSQALNSLMDSLYTGRFVVEGGIPRRYAAEGKTPPLKRMSLSDIPDGTYEFYHGKAYSIAWGGVATELPVTHPIYNRSADRIVNLFNLGIDFASHQAYSKSQFAFPHRYAYFRDGDLYVMGSIVMKKDDPVLAKFVEKEKAKESAATEKAPYLAFTDNGAPDEATIKAFGLKIPEKHYLALGDNHAMSGDSRVWGFVPQDNIQGAPSYILWPWGTRQGFVDNEPHRSLWTLPNILIGLLGWGTVATLCFLHYRKTRRSQIPPDLHA